MSTEAVHSNGIESVELSYSSGGCEGVERSHAHPPVFDNHAKEYPMQTTTPSQPPAVAPVSGSSGGYRQIIVVNQEHPAAGERLHIPQVELMHLGLAPSVEDMVKKGPKQVAQRPSCRIDAAGRVFQPYGDQWLPQSMEQDPSSKRAFYGFPYGSGVFKLWTLRALYLAFIADHIPLGCRVEPRDGNHANCRLDNLVLEVCQDEIEKHLLN